MNMIFQRFSGNMLIKKIGRKIGLIGLIGPILLAGCATFSRSAKVEPVVPADHFSEIEADPVPLVMNDRVQDWLNYFQGPGRERFEVYLSRSGKYVPMIKKILREYSLPQDLVYLAMIESGFNPRAYSRARATGTWQFIYRTGIRYGLRVDEWIDERRDPEKSTIAAAKYLQALYDRFNDWYLAAAGYNAGEGKIGRAIRRYRTEDFWVMSRQRYLKRETKDYVPKMIAAALISKNPKEYGFDHVRYEEPIPYDKVAMETPTDLRVAAQCAGVSYEAIKLLNPDLKRWITPPNYPGFELRVPAGTGDLFLIRYQALTPEERIADEVYTARAGETVTTVAKKQGIPGPLLAAINSVSLHKHLSAGETLLIPREPPPGEKFHPEKDQFKPSTRGQYVYRVRRGDNLFRISRHLGVRPSKLKNLNPHVDWEKLQYGRTLRLATGAVRHASVQARIIPPVSDGPVNEGEFLIHTVQEGDSLWTISRRYGVSVNEIRRLNQVRRMIHPGQTLRIPQTAKAVSHET